MSNWTKSAKKIAAGKWIRFDAQNPQYTLNVCGRAPSSRKGFTDGAEQGRKV